MTDIDAACVKAQKWAGERAEAILRIIETRPDLRGYVEWALQADHSTLCNEYVRLLALTTKPPEAFP